MFKSRKKAGTALRRTRGEEESDESEERIDVKRPKATPRAEGATAGNLAKKVQEQDITGEVIYSADSSQQRQLQTKSNATKEDTLNTELRQEKLEEKEARAKKEEKLKQKENGNEQDGVPISSASLYHGQKGYVKYDLSKPRRFGPIREATSIRSTTVVDYQPDVCKDYKQTGYCGYGDSCKFLHMREDYKAGWKLDEDWEAFQAKTKNTQKEVDNKEEATTQGSGVVKSAEIPFKCVICKQDYKSPVVTKCEHYFCESCFMDQFRNKGVCAICGKNTGGSARPVKDIKKLLLTQS